MDRQTFTIEETAEILGIGRSAAYQAARDGQIPVIKLGRRLLVPKVALERMLDTSGAFQDKTDESAPVVREISR